MGYYHENEADDMVDAILGKILDELSSNGVIVVASAGNDATDRPSYPAAFTPWIDDKGPVKARRRPRAGRLGRGAQPQPHRRAVHQRRTLGALLRAGRLAS